jgi:spermidine synthase
MISWTSIGKYTSQRYRPTVPRSEAPRLAIALVSAGLLAYEVLLTRLFSIIQWHHFAYMIISIALLGYGASGSFLALAQDRLRRNFIGAFGSCAALFAVSAVAAFAAAQRLPFNPLAVIWEPTQLLYLAALYLLFTVPFACGATCIGLGFAAFPRDIGRIYRSDLLGAGSGALGVVAALFLLSPPQALRAVAILGLAGAALAGLRASAASARWRAGLYGLAGLAVLAIPSSWTSLRLSEYKGLAQALLVPGAEVLGEQSSPLGLLTVVHSPTIPFRHAPGLSLNNPQEPPPQLGVFTDGDALSAITAFDGRLEPLSYLDYTTAALPFHLVEHPRVLILGAGGGADVLLALFHGAAHIDAIELDPGFVRLAKETYADFAGHLYDRPEVWIVVAEARGFVAGSSERYDLIELPLLDSFATAAAGTLSLSENYIYTVEAIEAYLRHLRPGGYLAITRWLKLPPRDSLKLFGTALEALVRIGVVEPARQVALLRSWTTTTLLVKNDRLTDADITRIRDFAAARSFDLAWYPGMQRAEADRFNILEEPDFFDGAAALAGSEREAFLDRYKFDLRPATDDRPFFFDFFKWRALPELLARRATGGAALLDWGYPILVATLAQAGALSLLLVLAPLGFLRGRNGPVAGQWRIAVYFLVIGLAFLFVEIASIQRFVLFLSHPLYAMAVVVCAFLVFAGLGSGAAAPLERRLQAWRMAPGISPITLAVAGVALVALPYLFVLPPLFDLLMPLPDMPKILISLALIAPLAFFMGMPFPLALSRVATRTPALLPWAWGINGCASVLGAILAILLAMAAGFRAVMLIALALYGLAAATSHAWFEPWDAK